MFKCFRRTSPPIFHRKNFPFIDFKGNKKSFPKCTKQLCPYSFSRCPGLRESSEHWSPSVPLSHLHTVLSEGLRKTCPRGDGSDQSERAGEGQLRYDPRWEKPTGCHGSTAPELGSPALAPGPPLRCCPSCCPWRSGPSPPPRCLMPRWPPGPGRQSSKSGHCRYRDSRNRDPSAAPGSENGRDTHTHTLGVFNLLFFRSPTCFFLSHNHKKKKISPFIEKCQFKSTTIDSWKAITSCSALIGKLTVNNLLGNKQKRSHWVNGRNIK